MAPRAPDRRFGRRKSPLLVPVLRPTRRAAPGRNWAKEVFGRKHGIIHSAHCVAAKSAIQGTRMLMQPIDPESDNSPGKTRLWDTNGFLSHTSRANSEPFQRNDYLRHPEVMFGIEQNSPDGGGMIRQWKDRRQVSHP